jgi:agmatinase
MKKLKGFGGLPEAFKQAESSEIVIVSVPYDRTSTWGKGADKGPEAIIEASANMELYDIETDSEVYRKGIFTDKAIRCNAGPEQMVVQVEKRVSRHIDKGKFVVSLGGEHSVSIGAVEAHAKKFKNMSVLQLDAHADLREEYLGSKYNHACVMARIREIAPIVQVGIRSMDICEKRFLDKQNIFLAEDIYNNQGWIEKALKKLSKNVYITIDLDVFDPSIMPSTGTPEPGGLLWYDVLAFLKAVCKRKDVVGFDVVELCPVKHDRASDFLAAKLIYKLLSYIFRAPKR